jgi:hypothetical protein
MGSCGKFETRALQAVVALGCVVPIAGGLSGVIFGPVLTEEAVRGLTDLDSQFRYLSGLLLGIGVGFASTIPQIERHRARFLLLTGIVVVGGLGRLVSAVMLGPPTKLMVAALIMELVVTPALCFWQMRIAGRVAPPD